MHGHGAGIGVESALSSNPLDRAVSGGRMNRVTRFLRSLFALNLGLVRNKNLTRKHNRLIMDDFKRREFIRLSALGFAGIALQLDSISSHAQLANAHCGAWNDDTKLNWDAFLERLDQCAKSQHELPWDQKLYTEQVKQLLLQCNFPEFENVKKEIEAYEDRKPNLAEVASLHREVDFQVSLFQFEKGEYISHHDHPDMTGVINVVSGNILAKNYTIEEQFSTTRKVIKNGRTEIMQKCTLREVGNENIKKGDVSILTAHEGNIHSVMPNEFTQLVDVFTPAYKPDTKSNWYSINEDGFYEGRKNVFEAEYVNKELSKVNEIQLSKEKLTQCVGLYKAGNNFIKISLVDRHLVLERTRSLDAPGMKSKLFPYEENKFWLEGQDIRCIFNLDNENHAESVTIHLAKASISAKRLK